MKIGETKKICVEFTVTGKHEGGLNIKTRVEAGDLDTRDLVAILEITARSLAKGFCDEETPENACEKEDAQ